MCVGKELVFTRLRAWSVRVCVCERESGVCVVCVYLRACVPVPAGGEGEGVAQQLRARQTAQAAHLPVDHWSNWLTTGQIG